MLAVAVAMPLAEEVEKTAVQAEGKHPSNVESRIP